MSGAKLFSSGQAFAATLVGGPVAAVYIVLKNNEALDDTSKNLAIMVYGYMTALLLLFAAPFIPFSVWFFAPPLAFALGVYYVVARRGRNHSKRKRKIPYVSHDSAHVAKVALAALAASFGVVAAWAGVLAALRII